MDLLRSYELYELLQLYVVSEIAITANRTELYAALFTTLVPKPLDLEEVKRKFDKVSAEGNEPPAFLQPQVILELFKARLDELKTRFERDFTKPDNTATTTSTSPITAPTEEPHFRPIVADDGNDVTTPLSPTQESNASSTDIHFFEDYVTLDSVATYRQHIDKEISSAKKVMEKSHT